MKIFPTETAMTPVILKAEIRKKKHTNPTKNQINDNTDIINT